MPLDVGQVLLLLVVVLGVGCKVQLCVHNWMDEMFES